jgi:hypothetical protein
MTAKAPPRQGDQVPGHVVVLIGVEADGTEVPFQAQDLDRPFLGFFYPQNLHPAWRWDMLPAAEFRQKYPTVVAR